ncbi:MAG: hypothetical protein H6747_14355 [Deltaproteobacteria bacterium]|nr:hypothetical protein [Deltaproteobacteria bacterium]
MDTSLFVALDPSSIDAAASAAVLAPVLGAHLSDVTMQLRRSDGFVELPIATAATEPVVTKLHAAEQRWFAVAPTMVPRLPKALTATGLDPRPTDALLLPVRMTGPPERVDPARVLAAVPLRWGTASTAVASRPAPKSPNVGKVAMSIATTGGVGLLFGGKGKKGGSDAAKPTTTVVERSMLALVVLDGPGALRRLHIFADRCDYRVLDAPEANVEANWRALLSAVRARLRPRQAGAALLDAAIAGEAAALWGFDDDNALAERLRWLILCATLRRMGAA